MLKITHAAGHGYNTSGKRSPDGYREWQYTSEIVKLVFNELANYENVAQKRIDDPTGAVDIPLLTRSNAINSWGSNLHIDYHMNAYGTGWNTAGGTETFVYTTTLTEAYLIAKKVQANLVSLLGFADRGVKAGDFHMLRETNCTAILIEFAFMTNQNEATKMRTAEYQKKAATAIVNAIVAQYGLKRKYVAPAVPNGWVQVDSKWYFFENGVKKLGWLEWDGRWWYLDVGGVMIADTFKKIGEFWYYFKPNGQLMNNVTLTVGKDGAVKV